MRRDTKRWLARGSLAILIAAALGYAPYHLYARSGLGKVLALRKDLESLRARNADLRTEAARLQREVRALRDDPRAVELVARQELGWVRPGEIVFQVQ